MHVCMHCWSASVLPTDTTLAASCTHHPSQRLVGTTLAMPYTHHPRNAIYAPISQHHVGTTLATSCSQDRSNRSRSHRHSCALTRQQTVSASCWGLPSDLTLHPCLQNRPCPLVRVPAAHGQVTPTNQYELEDCFVYLKHLFRGIRGS